MLRPSFILGECEFARKVEVMYSVDSSRAEAELQTARVRLAAAAKSSIEAALHGELITALVAAGLLDNVDQRLNGEADVHEATAKKPVSDELQSRG